MPGACTWISEWRPTGIKPWSWDSWSFRFPSASPGSSLRRYSLSLLHIPSLRPSWSDSKWSSGFFPRPQNSSISEQYFWWESRPFCFWVQLTSTRWWPESSDRFVRWGGGARRGQKIKWSIGWFYQRMRYGVLLGGGCRRPRRWSRCPCRWVYCFWVCWDGFWFPPGNDSNSSL